MGAKRPKCLFVRSYPINVRTPKPIGPTFVWNVTNLTPGKVHGWSELKNVP